MTPFPHDLISPDHTYSNKRGGDSGQGESDEDRRHCSSDSSEEGEEEVPPANREVLRWKRGRVLGKGAFGKVCEGLMDNAKLIAVKEIELDMDTTREKAELVRVRWRWEGGGEDRGGIWVKLLQSRYLMYCLYISCTCTFW